MDFLDNIALKSVIQNVMDVTMSMVYVILDVTLVGKETTAMKVMNYM